MVRASAAEVIQSLMLISASVPLAKRANEYTDFATLFSTQESEGQYILKFQNEGNSVVSMVPYVKRQPIHNIEQWTTAFATFDTTYTEKHQAEATK